MSDVSMEYAAVQDFLNKLEGHHGALTTHYNSTRGEVEARTASYLGAGGDSSRSLLPLLDDHHTAVSNILQKCHEVLSQHHANNVGGDSQQQEALKKASNVISSTVTSGLT